MQRKRNTELLLSFILISFFSSFLSSIFILFRLAFTNYGIIDYFFPLSQFYTSAIYKSVWELNSRRMVAIWINLKERHCALHNQFYCDSKIFVLVLIWNWNVRIRMRWIFIFVRNNWLSRIPLSADFRLWEIHFQALRWHPFKVRRLKSNCVKRKWLNTHFRCWNWIRRLKTSSVELIRFNCT